MFRLRLRRGTSPAYRMVTRTCSLPHRNIMSSFATYIIGFIILIVGLAIAAHLLGAPALWIAVGAIILIGIAIVSAATRTQSPDQPR